MRTFFVVALLLSFSMAANANGHVILDTPNLGALEPEQAQPSCVPATSGDYLALCNRFHTERGMQACIAAGNGRYFERCALNLCHRFNTENGAISCIEASRDRTYLDSEMLLCNRQVTEAGAINCLIASGRPYRGGGGEVGRAFLMQLRRDVIHAIYDIEAGRSSRALETLDDVVDRLDDAIRRN